MRSQYLLLLGLASPLLADITCGVSHGYDRGTNAYFFSGDGSLANFDACSAKCQSDSMCQSLAFGDSQCLLYAAPLDTNFRAQTNSPFLFYDRDCVNVKATSSFATVLPPTTSSSAAAPTTPVATTPTSAAATPSTTETSAQGGGVFGSSSSGQAPSSTAGATSAAGGSGNGGGQTAASALGSSGAAAGTASAGKSNGASSSATGTSSSGTSRSTATGSLQSGVGSAAAPAMSLSSWWLASSALCCLFVVWI